MGIGGTVGRGGPAAAGGLAVLKRAPSPVAQYGFTLAAVALATLLRFALAPLVGEGAPFILYYPTVVLCAWLWGLWPGVLATGLGGLAAWYFFIPLAYSFAFVDRTALVWLALYVVAGVLISLMAESLHRARRKSQEAEAKERAAHARDVAERSRDQGELLGSRERLRMVIEGSPIAKVMIDRAGRIALINAQTERLFGYLREELIGQPVEMLIPERFRRSHPRYRTDFAAAPQTRPMGAGRDLYGLRKDGSEVPIEIGLNPVEVEGETLVLSAILDLTERKRAEAALTEAARYHEALYDFVARLQRAGSFAAIYDAGVDAMLNALGCDRASILLHDEKKVMRFVASRSLSEDYKRAVEGHSPWAADEEDPHPVSEADIATSEFDEHLKALLKNEGIAALAFIPLVIDGKLGGKFMTYYDAPHAFDDVEL